MNNAKLPRCAVVGRFGLALTMLAPLGCSPSQEGGNQCPDFNVNVTALKDTRHEGCTIAEVDAIVSAYRSANSVPGLALGIVKDNEVHYLKGYGFADLGDVNVFGDERAWTIGTPSSVGSISKTFTALAVLRLHDEGALDIDDTVGVYIPGLPNAWAGWTIQQVLAHQTGLRRDPTGGWPLDEAPMQAECPGVTHPGIRPLCALAGYDTTPIVGFAPGTTMRYSNMGYALAGALVDAVTTDAGYNGVAGYENYVWHSVGSRGGSAGEPTMISMCLSTDWRQNDIKNLARDYRPVRNNNGDITGLIDFPPTGYTGAEGPAGGWTMTIGDLTRLMIAINDDKLLDPNTKAEMMKPHGQEGGSASYGLGVFRKTELNRTTFLHAGQYEGYMARYIMWPNENFGVAVMVNRELAGLTSLTRNIAALFLSGGSEPVKVCPPPDSRIAQSATRQLVRRHEETIRTIVDPLLAAAGGDARLIESRVLDLLFRFDGGRNVYKSILADDFEGAAGFLLPILDEIAPLPGDCDGDGDVDLSDYIAMQACITGPGGRLPTACPCFDLDGDNDVDLSDMIEFETAFTGAR